VGISLEIKDPEMLIMAVETSQVPEEFVRNFAVSWREIQLWESTSDMPRMANAAELYEWMKGRLATHSQTGELPTGMPQQIMEVAAKADKRGDGGHIMFSPLDRNNNTIAWSGPRGVLGCTGYPRGSAGGQALFTCRPNTPSDP
jgi:hypothetical protein